MTSGMPPDVGGEEQAVAAFIQEFCNVKQALPQDSDVFGQLAMAGDDCFEFVDRFFEKHQIDLEDYLWYFHHEEEGYNFGAFFFRPPNARVDRIAITPAILAASIRNRRWAIQYPPHSLPSARWDIRINQAISLGLIIATAFWVFGKFVR